jgi:hypothetical protein
MRGRSDGPVVTQDLDTAEQRFYVVMHHMATVLWMKGAVVEALAALSGVLEEASKRMTAVPPPSDQRSEA